VKATRRICANFFLQGLGWNKPCLMFIKTCIEKQCTRSLTFEGLEIKRKWVLRPTSLVPMPKLQVPLTFTIQMLQPHQKVTLSHHKFSNKIYGIWHHNTNENLLVYCKLLWSGRKKSVTVFEGWQTRCSLCFIPVISKTLSFLGPVYTWCTLTGVKLINNWTQPVL